MNYSERDKLRGQFTTWLEKLIVRVKIDYIRKTDNTWRSYPLMNCLRRPSQFKRNRLEAKNGILNLMMYDWKMLS